MRSRGQRILSTYVPPPFLLSPHTATTATACLRPARWGVLCQLAGAAPPRGMLPGLASAHTGPAVRTRYSRTCAAHVPRTAHLSCSAAAGRQHTWTAAAQTAGRHAVLVHAGMAASLLCAVLCCAVSRYAFMLCMVQRYLQYQRAAVVRDAPHHIKPPRGPSHHHLLLRVEAEQEVLRRKEGQNLGQGGCLAGRTTSW